MNIEDKFEFTSKFGTVYPIAQFVVDRYFNNGNLFLGIQVYDEGGEYWEPYCDCTTNTNNKLSDDYIAIKNYSENEGIDEFLVNIGIIDKVPHSYISSGFVKIPIYKLTESGKELFSRFDEKCVD